MPGTTRVGTASVQDAGAKDPGVEDCSDPVKGRAEAWFSGLGEAALAAVSSAVDAYTLSLSVVCDPGGTIVRLAKLKFCDA